MANDPLAQMNYFERYQRATKNVGYEPGQVGWAFPELAKLDFQVAQYEALYGERDRQLLMRSPLWGAVMWMMICGSVMIAFAFVAVALIWVTVQVAWILTPIVAPIIIGMWVWFGWLVYWKLPITAMIIHRGRGEPFAHWYGFTDKWRARWNTDEQWELKYGA